MRAELLAAGTDHREIWAQLEMLNTGRLRFASKGIEHDGAEVDEATQAAEGMYMAGQVAVLRDARHHDPALHAEVTAGAGRFHDRMADLRESLALDPRRRDAGEPPSRWTSPSSAWPACSPARRTWTSSGVRFWPGRTC